VEAFNQLFQSNWGRESGIVFDTNVYTSGHMRPDAFKGDGAKLNLVNKIVKKLGDIEEEGNLPTAEQRAEINSLVSRINGLQDVTITDTLPPLEVSNLEAFEEIVTRLRTTLQRTVRQQYQSSKEQYGAGPEFDELANVMSLVHMREFWHQQGSEESEWSYMEQRLTNNELPENIRNLNQERLDLANQTHHQLAEERQEKIAQLQQQFPGYSQANLEMRATNELYVEYLRLIRNQLNNIRAAEEAGVASKRIKTMRLRLQELQSKALFFANEAYMTAIAAEQVVLNQQIGLEVELPTAQYPASIAEQTAFIGEQIERYENNPGRALWKTAKYVDRVLTAIETIHRQTGRQVPGPEIMQQVVNMRPLVRELLVNVKKNADLNDLQKDEAAINLVSEYPTVFDSNQSLESSEWGRILLNLQIDVNLQVQEYLMNQPNSSGSSQTDSSSE
ncbi:MAG: hypothetical protein WA865_17755, partial [Spirulinaceae cyanobacterium]